MKEKSLEFGYEEVIKRETDKQRCFANIRDSLASVDDTRALCAVNEALKLHGSLPDVEYSMLGNSEYGFFYTLVEAFYTKLLEAKGSQNIVSDLIKKFRSCSHILYSNSVIPDVKALSSWTALSTGTLKSPFLLNVLNPNQGYVPMEEGPAPAADVNDLTNCPYPLYMPYLEYTPEQRVLFDEFVHYMSYVQEMAKKGRDIKEIMDEYRFGEIKAAAASACALADEGDIRERAELDEMNVRLARFFDYYSSCFRYMECERVIAEDEPSYSRFISKGQKSSGIVPVPEFTTDPANMSDFNHQRKVSGHIYASMVRQGLRRISKDECAAYLRVGFALFSPVCHKEIDSMDMESKLRMLDEYCAFKRSLFSHGSSGIRLKNISDLASVSLPSYAGICISDIDGHVPYNGNTDREAINEDTQEQDCSKTEESGGRFRWLFQVYLLMAGYYDEPAGSKRAEGMLSTRIRSDPGKVLDVLGIARNPGEYEGPCL